VAAGAVTAAVVCAEDLIKFSRNVPGETKPIVVDADEIVTWTEGDTRILLLKGQVLVQHGTLRAQFQDGVFFVDLKSYKATRIWNVDLYGEGGASVQNGAVVTNGKTAFLDLHTRGDLKLNAHKSKLTQEARPNDPVYQRGAAQRASIRGSPAPAPPPPAAPAPAPPPPAAPAPAPPAPPAPAPPPALPPPAAPAPAPQQLPPLPPPQGTNPIQRTVFTEPAEATGSVTPAAPVQGLPPPVLPAPSVPLLPPVPSGPSPGGSVTPGPPATGSGAIAPGAPGPGGLLTGPLGGMPPGGPVTVRQFNIVPRNPSGFQVLTPPPGSGSGQPPDLVPIIITGGFILTVRSVDPKTHAVEILDIEADRGVIWRRSEARDRADPIQGPAGLTGRELEFYLAGNVEIRQRSGKEDRTLRADEIYYDVNRNVALALTADLEWRQPGVPDMIHFTADELQQLSPANFRGLRGTFYSSKLPSDPGLKVVFAEATLDEKKQFRRNIFGREIIDVRTDQPAVEVQKLVRADDIFLRVEDVPVFYLPFLQGDVNDPLGPIRDISMGYNNIYGFQVGVSWDVYDLIGITRLPNTNWHMDTDYLSLRGPAVGTQYDFTGKDPFGVQGRYSGTVKLWGIADDGTDRLGGGRDGQPHPEYRDRVQIFDRLDDGPYGFSGQFQFAHFSDQNVQEQYDKAGFDGDRNQEAYLYVKQQPEHANWAWTLLGEERLRDWFTETNWLPRMDGYVIGESFFDLFSYDVHGSLGYAQLRPASVPPPTVTPTDVAVNTGRFDLMQEIRMPFYLGPVKVVPYADLDLTYYTADNEGQQQGRVYGGGGVMASLPFTRLYPDVHSLLWNLDGINHKIVLSGNYYVAGASDPYTLFPQLDRLNDDVNDYSLRYITPIQPQINPANGYALQNSPTYNAQLYAIRQLLMNRVDTLNDIQELSLDLRQRWQTKRGFAGQEHIVDWMTLDLSATLFPAAKRDDFNSTVGLVQYDWNWNIGDRTALTSSGWIEPETDGARFFSFGAYLNRTDRTSLFLGYRQIDPLESKAVTASVSYVFSPKYALTASTTYDFGTSEALSNSLVLTRMGSDVQVSLGLTYNALTSSFGVTFEIVPNLVGNRRVPGFGPGLLQR